jgi:hypothetical protein
MPSTPPTQDAAPQRIRLTISVSPEVHAAYARLAAVSNSSIGREMGDFLQETLQAVEFVTDKMEQARSAPQVVMREMHAYALGLADETGALMEQLRLKRSAVVGGVSATGAALSPPSSNTGGKVPRKAPRKGSGSRS